MIGYKKIKKASKLNEDVYFVLCFTDGLYYYKYDEEQKLEIKCIIIVHVWIEG